MKHFIKVCLRRFGFEIKRYKQLYIFECQVDTWLKQNQVDVVLDIGANTGQYASRLLANGFNGDIISFEPLSDAYKKLIENSSKNKNWHIAPRMAIGDFNGEKYINISANSESSSIMPMLPLHESSEPSSKYINTEQTKVCTLDGLIGSVIPSRHKSIFLKIDTQGYEDKVLSGIKDNFNMVKAIQVELSTIPLYEGQKLYYEIIDFLVKKEFILYAIGQVFTDKLTGKLFQFDGFFVR